MKLSLRHSIPQVKWLASSVLLNMVLGCSSFAVVICLHGGLYLYFFKARLSNYLMAKLYHPCIYPFLFAIFQFNQRPVTPNEFDELHGYMVLKIYCFPTIRRTHLISYKFNCGYPVSFS